MRVTRAIREYVEEAIRNKYKDKIESLGSEYKAERDDVIDHVKEIMKDAENTAREYIKSRGFEHKRYYSEGNMFDLEGVIFKKEEEDKINDEKSRLCDSRDNKIKQLLFNLEVNAADKSELLDLINSITVD